MPSNSIEVGEEAGVRYLHFGSEWIQGAMRIARPWNLELEYTREMMACLLFHPEPDWPNNVLLIGLGAGSLTKFLHRHRPHAHLTVVEIDPRVVGIAHNHFKLPEDEKRIEIVIEDGARYVENTQRQFDLILVDGFDANASAGELGTSPFYQHCRQRLTEEGLMVVNLFGRTRGFKASFLNIVEAFGDHALAFPSCDAGNAIAFAGKHQLPDIDMPAFRQAGLELKQQTGLNLGPTLSRLEQALAD